MTGGQVEWTWMSLLRYSFTVLSVKMAVHWWSQIWPTDSKEPEARLGKPWEMVAEWGRPCTGKWAVDCEVMIWPFGTMTLTEGFEVDVGRWGI